ncbi:MAG: very short patch repair endonuclease [Candidatus Sedimenticola sp. (ex Thyasira tokunagai)]
MSKIKGKNTKPEITFRKALWALGLRYHLRSSLPGKPDIVFKGKKLAVFVDGCFWHGCPEHGTSPKTNVEFWAKKIAANKERDKKVDHKLRSLGWSVIRIWEHQINDDIDSSVKKISYFLGSNDK